MGRKKIYNENFDRLVKLGILKPDGSLTFKHFMKIENEPYMFLDIENHGNNTFSMAHYNSDLMIDPQMEILIIPEMKAVEPLSIEHITGHYARVYTDDTRKQYYTRERKDQNSFLNMWTKNLMNQGFAKGKVTKK